MEGIIHFDGELVEPLFDAINGSPFSDSLKRLLIGEILTTPRLLLGGCRSLSFFESADVTTSDTGDARIRLQLTGPGEAMLAAFRALCGHPADIAAPHPSSSLSSCASEEKRAPVA